MQAKELREGTVVIFRGDICTVTAFHFYSPGNKRAFVQAMLQSLKTGKTIQNRFSSTEDVEEAKLDYRKCQYLYQDSEGLHFMDLEDYQSFALPDRLIGDKKYYLRENDEVGIDFYEGNPVQLDLPNQVLLKLTEAPPWVRGDSVSNNMKPAVTETGLKIQVPIFLKEGEIIKVDTKNGTYVGRK